MAETSKAIHTPVNREANTSQHENIIRRHDPVHWL